MTDPGRDPGSRHPEDPGAVAQPPVPFLVTGGGVPTEAEQAAIGQALARVIHAARAQAAGSGVAAGAGAIGGGHAAAAGVPAWTRAALTEATTSVRITSPNELPP